MVARVSILLATIFVLGIVGAHALQTNAVVHWLMFTNTSVAPAAPAAAAMSSTNRNQLLPLIKFDDVPITTAIENLAREAEINYIVEPNLFPSADSNGNLMEEPFITLRLKNINAKDALDQILNDHELAMVEDTITSVARIVRRDESVYVLDASLLSEETNQLASSAKLTIPMIQFQDVPLDVALENLLKQASISYEIDRRITGIHRSGQFTEFNGVVVRDKKTTNHLENADDNVQPDSRFDPMPTLSLRWTNITPRQGIIAICQNYDLTIVKDQTTDVLRIEPRTVKKHHRNFHW